MWELDCEEVWAPKNWCFWTVVLEKTLESPLDCKEISPGCSLEGLMLKLKLQYFGHLMWSWLIGKDSDAGRDWGQEEKRTTEDEMAGWHHWLDGRESEWTLGVGDGQGGQACCDSWGCKELDTAERLNWTESILHRFGTIIFLMQIQYHQSYLFFFLTLLLTLRPKFLTSPPRFCRIWPLSIISDTVFSLPKDLKFHFKVLCCFSSVQSPSHVLLFATP